MSRCLDTMIGTAQENIRATLPPKKTQNGDQTACKRNPQASSHMCPRWVQGLDAPTHVLFTVDSCSRTENRSELHTVRFLNTDTSHHLHVNLAEGQTGSGLGLLVTEV